jgi:hypothetical protein
MAVVAAPEQAHVRPAIVLDQIEGAALRGDRDGLTAWHGGNDLTDPELGQKMLELQATLDAEIQSEAPTIPDEEPTEDPGDPGPDPDPPVDLAVEQPVPEAALERPNVVGVIRSEVTAKLREDFKGGRK